MLQSLFNRMNIIRIYEIVCSSHQLGWEEENWVEIFKAPTQLSADVIDGGIIIDAVLYSMILLCSKVVVVEGVVGARESELLEHLLKYC